MNRSVQVTCSDPECLTPFERSETDTGKIVPCPKCQTQVRVPVSPDGGLTGEMLGDYKLVRRVARGGMGEIYEAVQIKLDRKVAVKIISEDLAANPAFMLRFEREAKAAAALNHPNVVQIYDFGQVEGRPFFVMEYVDGEDLSKLTTRHSKLPMEQTLQIIEQVAIAMQEAHSMGIIHRDIKPANILLTSKGKVKVSDLGLAKRIDDDLELTATGVGIGSPHFISPEQADDARTVDHRADIYSLGVTLLFLLTGKRPFDGSTAFSIVLAHANKPLPSGGDLGTELPDNVEALIRRMAAKSPENRYPDYASLIADIRRVQAGNDLLLSGVDEAGSLGASDQTQEMPGTVQIQPSAQLRVQPQPAAQPQTQTISTFTFNMETSLPPTRTGNNRLAYGVAALAVGTLALFLMFRDSPDSTSTTEPGGVPNIQAEFQQRFNPEGNSYWWEAMGHPSPLQPLPRMNENPIPDGTLENMLADAEDFAERNQTNYLDILIRFRQVRTKAADGESADRIDAFIEKWSAERDEVAEREVQRFEQRMNQILETGTHPEIHHEGMVVWHSFPDQLRSQGIDNQIREILSHHPAERGGPPRGGGFGGPGRGPGPGGGRFGPPGGGSPPNGPGGGRPRPPR